MQPAFSHTARPAPVLTRFDGYPYLVTRVVPGMYHLTIVPWGAPRSLYLQTASFQYQANRLRLCMVLGPADAWYVGPKGVERTPREAPIGGVIVTDRLEPVIAFDPTPDLMARRARLARYIAAKQQTGYLHGDLTKGGRPATPAELRELAGFQPDGVPVGLERCPTCFEYRGMCLDPNPEFKGMVMDVHCRCQNFNRCARCRELLAERKLNANQYNEQDGMIWHLPGFSGFNHRCKDRVSDGSGADLTG